MLTLKFYRYNSDGSILDREVVSCPRYSRSGKLVVPRGVNDQPDTPAYPMYTVAPPAQREEDRVAYRFDECFVENEAGKTIDRVVAAAAVQPALPPCAVCGIRWGRHNPDCKGHPRHPAATLIDPDACTLR